MGNYFVRLNSVPDRHTVPKLLSAFARWLAHQPHGSVGRFELLATPVPESWGQRRDAWCFARLPDGASLALLDPHKPAPVVLLGTQLRTIATDLEDFLLALARAETGIADLDAGDGSGRDELATWLKLKKVRRSAARAR